jgi:uncharacterized protein (TIGR00661 family)
MWQFSIRFHYKLLSTETEKNILISPLNWGLGHATRCVPIIELLQKKPCRIFIAADGNAFLFLKKAYPTLTHLRLSDQHISYPENKGFLLTILNQLPGIIKTIFKEHFALKKIIKEHQIDVVISDNRFGLWNKKTKSIYITHQLNIISPGNRPFLNKLLFKTHRYFIKKYDYCWIPDMTSEPRLAGVLSEVRDEKTKYYYTGILSRFSDHAPVDNSMKYDVCVIISGPEPQRRIFQEIMMTLLLNSNITAVMALGNPNEARDYLLTPNLRIISNPGLKEMEELVDSSSIVIARSGYSTIMDLAVKGKKAILIPTPGQTEQEYLATYLSEKKLFFTQTQSSLNLVEALKGVNETTGIKIKANTKELQSVIESCIFS